MALILFVLKKDHCDEMIEYITTRELESKVKGKIRILKLKEDNDATIEFTCPECGFSEKRNESWGEPFVEGTGANQKFNIKCSKCEFTVKLLKLKREIKKK